MNLLVHCDPPMKESYRHCEAGNLNPDNIFSVVERDTEFDLVSRHLKASQHLCQVEQDVMDSPWLLLLSIVAWIVSHLYVAFEQKLPPNE